jgi:hypothetical protein
MPLESLGFQIQIEDLHLKYCILGGNPKKRISGRNQGCGLVTTVNNLPKGRLGADIIFEPFQVPGR